MAQGSGKAIANLMDLSVSAPTVSRKRNTKLIKRVMMKNYAIIMQRQRHEIANELQNTGKITSEKNKYHQDFLALNKNLILRKVLPDVTSPFSKVPLSEGSTLARKLSWFLRHGMAEKINSFSKINGSVDVKEASVCLKIQLEKVFQIVHPSYDKGSKRRFVIYETISNGSSSNFRIAALGGHSFPVFSPVGQYQLEITSIVQLTPLIHKTSFVKEIKKSGFLSQQSRFGGINFCSKENHYREGSSHEIHVDAASAYNDGYFFFGNYFSDVIYGTGKWCDDGWNGRIPLEYFQFYETE